MILTATRNGLSNDSTNPQDWNGEANKTLKDGPQVTFYRPLIYAALRLRQGAGRKSQRR